MLDLLNTTMLQNEPESENPNRLLGLLTDQADLLDQVVEHAMQDRETAQFDYTNWQRNLWSDKSVEEISHMAMQSRQSAAIDH